MNKQLKTSNGEVVSLGIEWTHVFGPGSGYTWNPVAGCRHGCRWEMPDGSVAECYAKVVAEGLAAATYPEGFQAHYWRPDKLDEPLRLETPAGVFLDSMSDLFGHWVPENEVLGVLDVVRRAHWHVFFSLTKNAPGLLRYAAHLPPNLWAGVSMPPTFMWGKRLSSDAQSRLLKRALEVLAALDVPVRWLSLEPLSFDVAPVLERSGFVPEWLVIGAASNGRVKFQPDPEWVRAVHDFADRHGIPVFHKGNLRWQARREDFPRWPLPRYVYVGHRAHKGRLADPVRRPDGRVVVGSGKGPRNALIRWADTGELCVVPARTLRLYEKWRRSDGQP